MHRIAIAKGLLPARTHYLTTPQHLQLRRQHSLLSGFFLLSNFTNPNQKKTTPLHMEKNYKIGDKTFVLDQSKAEEAFNSKKIINGKDTMFFNILPLKYQWAYDLY